MPENQRAKWSGTEVVGLAYWLMAFVVPFKNATLLSLMVTKKTGVSGGRQNVMQLELTLITKPEW